jgi:transcriptional regulator with XRE-family HTH domain
MRNLVARRKTLGLTQQALADRAGLSLRGYQDIEYGVVFGTEDSLTRLASALSCTAADLLTSEQKPLYTSLNPALNSDDIKALASVRPDEMPSLRAVLLSLRAMRRAKLVKKSV